jgi:iron complex outermembrane recepter protein
MKKILFTTAAALALMPFLTIAQTATPATTAVEADANELIVFGQGQSRQTQSIKSSDITLAAPGTSPLKVLDKLPGVTFQSADPFGAYEWSTRISVRGFNQNQLGFTLDGVTLGDMSYGNYNGLHISRAIINEDIARTELTQGAGSLDSATSSNLGGTLKFTSRNPSETMGGELAGSVGENASRRIYGRFETGTLENLGGLRAYVSIADQKAEKWKGYGEQKAQQINAKAVLPIGEGKLSALYTRSERREQDYQDLSIMMINDPKQGYYWDNFQPNWALANQVALAAFTGAPFPAGIKTLDDSYYYGAGVRDDNFFNLKYESDISQDLSYTATVYAHTNKGQGLWATPYVPSPASLVIAAAFPASFKPASPDNAYISVRTTEYDIDRKGFTGGLTYKIGDHKISGGLWFETNDFEQARRYYGETLARPSRNSLGFQSNPFFTQWSYKFKTDTTQLYIEDVWSITEALKVNFGFKSIEVVSKGQNTHDVTKTYAGLSAAGALNAEITSKDEFLPQVGAVYKIDNNYEVFATYTENLNAFVAAGTAGPFSSRSQANVNYVKNNLKPESSKTIEGGVRVKLDKFQGVAALYLVNFEDRLLGIAQGAGIVGNAAVLSNVGAVETKGLELAGTYRFTPDIKLYASYSYNDSQYQDDVVSLSGVVSARTKGKTVVNTPKNLLKTEVSYDNGTLFGTLGVNYTDERYYTYENIGGKVDASTISDLSVGYRFKSIKADVQLNVTNLTDEEYISTIGSNGFSNSDATNSSQTVLTAAPRQVFITLRKQF